MEDFNHLDLRDWEKQGVRLLVDSLNRDGQTNYNQDKLQEQLGVDDAQLASFLHKMTSENCTELATTMIGQFHETNVIILPRIRKVWKWVDSPNYIQQGWDAMCSHPILAFFFVLAATLAWAASLAANFGILYEFFNPSLPSP